MIVKATYISISKWTEPYPINATGIPRVYMNQFLQVRRSNACGFVSTRDFYHPVNFSELTKSLALAAAAALTGTPPDNVIDA